MKKLEKVIKAWECCNPFNRRCFECPYDADCFHDSFDRVAIADMVKLLKEQKEEYPVCEKCGKEIDHINTSVFGYDGSDSVYSIPITYIKENECVSFSINKNWTGYDLSDEERKDGICCPYCGKFPFNDSIKTEIYEPVAVDVMMWTSKGGDVE